MATSWLATAGADSDDDIGTPVPSDLEPLDYRIITLLFEGTRPMAIMAALALSPAEYESRVSRQSFTDLERRIEATMVAKITGSGDYEPQTAAKAEAPQAMRRLIAQSRTERDPKVRLSANQAVLKFAGVEPARTLERITPDKVLEQMTPDELLIFAAHRKWPSRFKEALRAYIPVDSKVDGGIMDVTPQRALPPPEDAPKSSLPPLASPAARG